MGIYDYTKEETGRYTGSKSNQSAYLDKNKIRPTETTKIYTLPNGAYDRYVKIENGLIKKLLIKRTQNEPSGWYASQIGLTNSSSRPTNSYLFFRALGSGSNTNAYGWGQLYCQRGRYNYIQPNLQNLDKGAGNFYVERDGNTMSVGYQGSSPYASKTADYSEFFKAVKDNCYFLATGNITLSDISLEVTY